MNANSRVTETLRSRWFATLVHLGLWGLLYCAVTGLQGKAPGYRDAQAFSAPPQGLVPVASVSGLLASEKSRAKVNNNLLASMTTTYFVPAPKPSPAAAPTSKKIDVTYQGFYQTSEGVRRAMVKVADGFLSVPLGGRVTTNFFIARADMQSLLLTNQTTQTNLLPLNVLKQVEVPLP